MVRRPHTMRPDEPRSRSRTSSRRPHRIWAAPTLPPPMSEGSLRDRLLALWFVRHPFEVLADALPALRDPAHPDEVPRLLARYRRLSRRGVVAVRVRTVLLVLFYFSAVATIVGGVGGIVGRFAFLDAIYRVAFAASAGFSIIFGLSAAVVNRYVGVLQNRLLVVGVRLHGARAREGE